MSNLRIRKKVKCPYCHKDMKDAILVEGRNLVACTEFGNCGELFEVIFKDGKVEVRPREDKE